MENKEIRKHNLEYLIDKYQREKGLNKAQFSELCGTSPSALSQLLGDKAVRNVGDKLARKIEAGLDLPTGWMDALQESDKPFDSNVSNPRPYIPGKRYPVLDKVQAGAWSEAVEAYFLKDIDLWLESDAHIQGEGFWLLVDGDSMTAPNGLSIPDGTYVLFDTGREATNGKLIIAKLTDSNEATFKKLVIDGAQRYLKGLNPAWPMVPVNGNCRVIGVAVETKLRLP